MTNEQAKRLDEAIAKAGLNWWEVQEKIGADKLTDSEAIETAIAVIEKMAQPQVTTERKCYTQADAEKAVVIYTRGANAEQQVKECEAYAEAKGYDVVGVIYDFEKELFKEIGNIDILIVSSLDRIARRTEEFYSVEAALAEDGIKIESASKHFAQYQQIVASETDENCTNRRNDTKCQKIQGKVLTNATKCSIMYSGIYRTGVRVD